MVDNVRVPTTMVALHLMRIPAGDRDDDFQRDKVDQKLIEQMARNWFEPLCQDLMLARYPEAALYDVVDGGRRFRAAKMKGLEALPCKVYDFASKAEAADFFLKVNELRVSLKTIDKFRARAVRGDAISVKVRDLIREIGRKPDYHGNNATTVGCVSTMEVAMAKDEPSAVAIIRLMGELCDGHPIQRHLFSALFEIERGIRKKREPESLATTYRDRVLARGAKMIEAEIHNVRKASGRKSGGPLLWRDGALAALNAGYKGKDIIKVETPITSARAAKGYTTRIKKVELLSQVGRRPPFNPEDRPHA